ncbi:fuseless domain containing protein [Nitzschia inconspicua]|uniref:Fuseless domain containing protein n=1 Tax=Nitzschia inconspicua TaxID=303405 RepID=A0A9K3KPE6_9STRA|nr:fuseless domain containing protein [Nitzschia inconspicua]
MSLLWTLLAVLSGFITSEPIVGLVDRHIENHILLCVMGRLRTYIMAWGTVAFWRLIWIFWDQFLGGTQIRWAILGHVLAIVVLTSIGCVSSICAPFSTLGIDSVPDANAVDEPLFAMLPLPHELLYVFGISRQPLTKQIGGEVEMGSVLEESTRTAAIEASKKRLPERVTQPMDIPEDVEVVPPLEPERYESSTGWLTGSLVPARAGEESQEDHQEPSVPSSTRAERSFRSYSQLQRFGRVRMKSEWAQ